MKFNWGHALYHATRWALTGALLGLVVTIVAHMTGGSPRLDGVIGLFWLFGLIGLGKEVFTKKYPDA